MEGAAVCRYFEQTPVWLRGRGSAGNMTRRHLAELIFGAVKHKRAAMGAPVSWPRGWTWLLSSVSETAGPQESDRNLRSGAARGSGQCPALGHRVQGRSRSSIVSAVREARSTGSCDSAPRPIWAGRQADAKSSFGLASRKATAQNWDGMPTQTSLRSLSGSMSACATLMALHVQQHKGYSPCRHMQ